jgi:hypothetical protein
MGGEDPLDVPVEDLREGEQPKGLGGGRAVDDEEVVGAAPGVVAEVLEGEDLLEPG